MKFRELLEPWTGGVVHQMAPRELLATKRRTTRIFVILLLRIGQANTHKRQEAPSVANQPFFAALPDKSQRIILLVMKPARVLTCAVPMFLKSYTRKRLFLPALQGVHR